MALATTTLSSAVTASDTSVVVASATSMAAGRFLLVDGEMMQATKGYVDASTTVPVLRGVGGTAQVAHAATANVTHGTGSDFANPLAGGNPVQYGAPAVLDVKSYSAAGAIDLPTGRSLAVRVLNGTSVIAATIAAPTKDQDGAVMIIVSNGAAAHTLTFAGGLSGAGSSYDVVTINATAPAALIVVACNALWIAPFAPAMGGTVTNLIGSIA